MPDRPNTRLATFAKGVHEKLADNAVEEHHERTSLSEHNGDYRVHWLHVGGAITAPRQSGGKVSEKSTDERAQVCKTKDADVELHMIAPDSEKLDNLHDAMISAICEHGGAGTRLGRYRIPTQQERELAGITNRAEYMVQEMVLPLPVLEERQQMRVAESTAETCGTIQQDGTIKPQTFGT